MRFQAIIIVFVATARLVEQIVEPVETSPDLFMIDLITKYFIASRVTRISSSNIT